MDPDSGGRLGPYEIVSLIGEGGMGRVYRARDSRLKRDVAVKALPKDLVGHPDRIARLRREAEALAALNHPHIAIIHDLLEPDGVPYLVLELVEGETLADRIRRGPLSIRESVSIATDIASALETAHARGIIHRDLKPANIKLTASGQVKVLDFGLAKMVATAEERTTPHAATATDVAATEHGVILGTTAYMSPEQARGQAVDARTDIWALGCVLFEMLSARPSFVGACTADVLAAVVQRDPDWSQLPPAVPATLHAVLRRCLRKDAAQRLHHAADVRLELEDVLADDSVGKALVSTASRGSRWAWAVAALTAAGAVTLLVSWLGRETAPAAPEMRVEITTPPSFDPVSLALSPDGTKLVFAATGDGPPRLWLRLLREQTSRPLAGTTFATWPFWSPDNRFIGFFADGQLKRVDLEGHVETIAAAPAGGGGAAWSTDGTIVFGPSIGSGLQRVAVKDKTLTTLTSLQPGDIGHRFPQFLNDSRRFIFYVSGLEGRRGVYLWTRDGVAPQRLADTDSSAAYAATGDLLFVRGSTLMSQPLDTVGEQLVGEAKPLADHVMIDGFSRLGGVTTSAAGPIAFRIDSDVGTRQLIWVDRSGRRQVAVGAADATSMLNPALSPDQRFVLLNRTVDGNTDIWQLEAARGVLTRITFEDGTQQMPVWSPDGSRFVFGAPPAGVYDIYEKRIGDAGSGRPMVQSTENKFPLGFSRDGRYLLYRNTSAGFNWDLYAADVTSEPAKSIAVVRTPFQEMIGELSPDGRAVAYQSNESGRQEIYVQSFPESRGRIQVSTAGGSQPRWRGDGQELFFIGLDSRMMAAPVQIDQKGQIEAGTAVALFEVAIAGGPVPYAQKQQYAVSPDGQRFLLNSIGSGAAVPITLILNWAGSAKR